MKKGQKGMFENNCLTDIFQDPSNQEEKERKPLGSGPEAERVSRRLGNFDPKTSITGKKLEEMFPGATHKELRAAALILGQKINTKVDRDAKRNKGVLIKWYDDHWSEITTKINYFYFVDEDGHRITRELINLKHQNKESKTLNAEGETEPSLSNITLPPTKIVIKESNVQRKFSFRKPLANEKFLTTSTTDKFSFDIPSSNESLNTSSTSSNFTNPSKSPNDSNSISSFTNESVLSPSFTNESVLSPSFTSGSTKNNSTSNENCLNCFNATSPKETSFNDCTVCNCFFDECTIGEYTSNETFILSPSPEIPSIEENVFGETSIYGPTFRKLSEQYPDSNTF